MRIPHLLVLAWPALAACDFGAVLGDAAEGGSTGTPSTSSGSSAATGSSSSPASSSSPVSSSGGVSASADSGAGSSASGSGVSSSAGGSSDSAPSSGASHSGSSASDTTAPAPAVLTAEYSNARDTVLIRFDAPGDDGSAGTATDFSLRRSREAITEGNFDNAVVVPLGSTFMVPEGGTPRTITVAQTWGDGSVWHYALRATDERGNASFSNSVRVDTVPTLRVNPTTLNAFGPTVFRSDGTAMGTPQVLTLSVAPSGLADVILRSVSLVGAGGHFGLAVAPPEDTVLKPGGARELSLAFTPRGPGALTGSLVIQHDDPARSGETTVALTGTGTSSPTRISGGYSLARRENPTPITFEVTDGNGWQDVVGATVDLRNLGGNQAQSAPCTGTGDTAVCAFSVTASAMTSEGTYPTVVTTTDASGMTATGALNILVHTGAASLAAAGQTQQAVQQVVNAAMAGSLLALAAGNHPGGIDLTKALTVVGLGGRAGTFVDCAPQQSAFVITASGTPHTVTFEGITFRGCAGALKATGVNLVVRNCSFQDNEATQSGGAIAMSGGGSLTVLGSEFSNNSATGTVAEPGTGGAIHVDGAASITLTDTVFRNNTAAQGGGAISARALSLTVNGVSEFANNTVPAAPGPVYSGGALLILPGTHTSITGAMFNNNAAFQGSAIAFEPGMELARLEVTNSVFQGNTGNAPALLGTSLVVTRTDFIGNIGGAIDTPERMGLITNSLERCTFQNNTASYPYAVATVLNATVSNCSFTDNNGPSLVMRGTASSLENSTFTGNRAGDSEPSMGGAGSVADAMVSGCTFRGNRGPSSGTLFTSGATTVDNCVMDGNVSNDSGGGISGESGFTLSNSLVINNRASDMAGGAVGLFQGNTTQMSTAVVRGCTFFNNAGAAGVYLAQRPYTSVTFVDSILWGNRTVLTSGGAPELDATNTMEGRIINVNHSLVKAGGILGGGNINGGGMGFEDVSFHNLDEDPQFANTALGNFRVSAVSPALDTGSQTSVEAGQATKSVRVDGALDAEEVDLGYHYAVP